MKNSPPDYVIVVAPQGAGKSVRAEKLRELFGCTVIVDDWDGRSKLPTGALALTNAPPPAKAA